MGHLTGIGILQPSSHQHAARWTHAVLTPPLAPPAKPKLLDRVRQAMRTRHYSRQEVRAVLNELDGTPRLVGMLLYGSGLRLLECLRLRVTDVDVYRKEITVRDGKGLKDRVTITGTICTNQSSRGQ